MSGELLRIVVPEREGNFAQVAQGTRCYVGDTELTGVVRIELVAEVNELWRARVDLMVKPPADLMAVAVIHYPTLWQRFRQWVKRAF